MSTRIPVHVVAGFLGAGKTSLVLAQLEQRSERCAVIVNDFGDAQVDATLLEGKALVRDIPGGCVCCTAPLSLVPTLLELLESQPIDRIFIEATGLARPADIVDTLRRSPLADDLALAPVVVVVDPEKLSGEPEPLVLEQLAAADVWVANRTDLASEEALKSFRSRAADHYPPLASTHEVTHGRLAPEALEGTAGCSEPMVYDQASTDGWASASATWGPRRVFDMGRVKALLGIADAERIKGVLHTDIGWYTVQRVGGVTTAVPTPIRSGSRMDVIGQETQAMLEVWLDTVDAAEWVPPVASDVSAISLVESDGTEHHLDRIYLAGLPGQVLDVGNRVPGRQGMAVPLARVLDLATAPGGSSFLVVASDGMVSGPTAINEVGDALLVHSLEGEALPADQGGPFRILVPPGEGKSACANVKKVVRVLLQAP